MTDHPPAATPDASMSPQDDSVRAFAADLSALRSEAGAPTLEQLAQRAGISKSVLSDAFAGRRLPTENTVRKLVAALGGDAAPWVSRRLALDPRHVSSTVPPQTLATSVVAEQSGPAPLGRLARPVSLATFLVGIAATAVVAVAASALVAGLVVQRAAPAADVAPTPESTYLPFADGVDPMLTICREDVVLAGGDEFLDGDVLVEMMYSNHCMAVWGRVTRYDGQAAGNSMSMLIYPRDDPDSDRNQLRSDSDLQSLYTTLLIEPDVEARVCGIVTITIGEETFEQPNPVCI